MYLESKNIKLILVIFQGTFLLQLGESFHGVVVWTLAEPDLNSPDEIRRRQDFIAGLELLEPHQLGESFHPCGRQKRRDARCPVCNTPQKIAQPGNTKSQDLPS
jgi:hypothetical protein